jgi:membrane protein YqaA with SNARE-associated domain
MASIWDQMTDFLTAHSGDPATYLLTLFVFSMGAAIILPIPVESALVAVPEKMPFIIPALAVGLGKGVGAIAVFFIGAKVEKAVLQFGKWGWFKWLLDKSESFVRRYGYFALFAILVIPFMLDTVTLYIFSLLNKEGKLLRLRWFALVNVLAGTTRASIILIALRYFGLTLF